MLFNINKLRCEYQNIVFRLNVESEKSLLINIEQDIHHFFVKSTRLFFIEAKLLITSSASGSLSLWIYIAARPFKRLSLIAVGVL